MALAQVFKRQPEQPANADEPKDVEMANPNGNAAIKENGECELGVSLSQERIQLLLF